MVLIRELSKGEMGTWALFLTITTLFEATKSGLLKNAHIMYVSASSDEDEKASIASSSFIINVLITLLFIIFIWFFANWLSVRLHSGTDLAIMLRWFIPGLIFMIFFSHLEAIQQSFLDFKGVFAGYLVRQIVFFIIIIAHLFLHKSFTLKYLAIYQCISVFLGTIVIYIYTKRYLLFRFNVHKEWVSKIFHYGKYVFGSGLIVNIFANFDQLMTATFMSSSYVAYYNVALRINQFIDVPSYAAAQILFPKTAQASVQEGNEKVKYFYERIVGILLSFTTPIALFIIVFPKFVITIIAGAQYADSSGISAVPILQLYMLLGLLRPMQNQAANTLNSIGKPQLCFWLDALGLAMNLGINYLCLSIWGFYGAAIGTFITCIIGTVIWYYVMKKQIGFDLPKVGSHMINSYKTVYVEAVNIISRKKSVE